MVEASTSRKPVTIIPKLAETIGAEGGGGD